MEIKKEGVEQVFIGEAKCKHCGCEFTYEDSDVFSENTGYSHNGVSYNNIYSGASSIQSSFYVICPHCQCYVKTESFKQKKSTALGLGLFITIATIFMIIVIAITTPKYGKYNITCPKCGDRMTILSKYDQYQCSRYNCSKPGTHITYHCDHCGEFYHVVE